MGTVSGGQGRVRPGEVLAEVPGGIGQSVPRPDGVAKVRGDFAYSSDLWADDMLWGATLRSPHPHARIRSVDLTGALRLAGVHVVLTHEDVPGSKLYGLKVADQPVLAVDVVRHQGEPVAVVAADHPEQARRATERIAVDYEVLAPVTDARAALLPDSPLVHPAGNLVRHVPVRRGVAGVADLPPADVVVRGEYEIGMQDQAFLGPESGLAVPAEDGGVDLYVATQWLHVDQAQVAAALGLPEDKVRLTLAGVGGAFGGREDLSMHLHACMLALRTGRPVKMVYGREESFFGHVHRHPGTLRYEHGATREGRLVYVVADIVLDGGAYTSSSPNVAGNAATLGAGPYDVPNVVIDARVAFTNNPPCGAMRGFGAVQACFAYESQMDRLAAELGLHPAELRIRNAMSTGSVVATGQVIDTPAPVADLVREVYTAALPPAADLTEAAGWEALPGGSGHTTRGEGVRRGVGYAVGFKNVGFSEGVDDYSTARVSLQVIGGRPTAQVHTAAAELGQGLVTVQEQIARTELGVPAVVVASADTAVGSAGSSSASRQTYVTGGAVRAACQEVCAAVLERAALLLDRPVDGLRLADGWVGDGEPLVTLAEVLGEVTVERTVRWRHPRTFPIDPVTGQGDAHVQYQFAAHRAVVDVDVDLGLVRVVEIRTAQDVGRAINPQAVLGQILGGTVQGLGLALMEEIRVRDGIVGNPSFTDYLIPTVLDVPPILVTMLELADPTAPYGLRGVGEAPAVSSTPAIVAAVRDATGRDLRRVPVRPEDIVGLPRGAARNLTR